MRKKTKRLTEDFFRVLDTEVLPYEVPVWFSNKIFRKNCNKFLVKATENGIRLFDVLTIPNLKGSCPYEYIITKNEYEIRQLGIMHPYAQLRVVKFYNDYGDIIPYYCSHSSTSLRYPWRIAKSIRSSDDKEEEDMELEETSGRQIIEDEDIPCINFLDSYCSSYYVYKKMNFFYKFYESYDFHKLEKKFTKYVQVDVSKCFNSIYTHSITWAIKGKEKAKEFMHASNFEHEFDDLMQEINYRETHGILIGPEISRIFAEIIFQKIDNNIIDILEKKYHLSFGLKYEYRRYVDDFIIFYNDEETINILQQELQKCLADYKMYLNKSKTQFLCRPFITNISICKMALKDFINDYYDHKSIDNTLKSISNPASYANKTIAKIKGIIKYHQDITYTSISGFLLSEFSRHLKIFLENINIEDNNISLLLDNIIVDIDIIFFILSMDIRVRTADIVTRIILNILQDKHFSSKMVRGTLHKKIFDSCHNLFYILKTTSIERKIERANILLLLSAIDDSFELTSDFINKNIFLKEEYSDYFVWISLMLYCRDKTKYQNIHSDLVDAWKSKMTNKEFRMNKTENFLFFLDSIACPYLSFSDKKDLILLLKNNEKIILSKVKDIDIFINEACQRKFHVDWENKKWLIEMSERKKYIFPYE